MQRSELWSVGYITQLLPWVLRAQVDAVNSQLSINQHLSNFISKTGEQNSNLALSLVCLCLQLISMAAAAVSTLQKMNGLANYRSVSSLSWKRDGLIRVYTGEDSGTEAITTSKISFAVYSSVSLTVNEWKGKVGVPSMFKWMCLITQLLFHKVRVYDYRLKRADSSCCLTLPLFSGGKHLFDIRIMSLFNPPY